MTFLIKVGSDRQKQITREDIITEKLAANACDLVYKIIDRKHAKEINASQDANIRVNNTHGGLFKKTSNYNRCPTITISVHNTTDINEADIIHEAQ